MAEQTTRKPKRLWNYLGQQEFYILLALIVIVGGAWGFVKLGSEIAEGETHAFDEKILLALRNPQDRADPLGPPWVEEMGRDFTALGGTGVITFLTLSLTGYLLLLRRRDLALLIVVAIFGGVLLNILLKQEYNRPRPDLVPHGMLVYQTSFPSGHSMTAAAAYLTLGALLARLQPRRRLKIYLMLVAMTLTFLVGVSRVYLGVHWPTDVLAGWTAGAIWALLCWLATWWLQKRGQLSQSATPVDEGEPAT